MRHAQLKAFHHVALAGGFSRAAEAMHLSQPAVSDQVGQLERTHDVLLFRRERRQVTLTEAGERLFALTRQLFDVEERIAALLTEERATVRGQLRLVVDSAQHVNGLLSRFRAAHSGVTVSVRTGNSAFVLAELRDYRADVGVIGAAAAEPDLDAVPLGASPLVAFAAREVAETLPAVLMLEDLTCLAFVGREDGSKTRALLEAQMARRGLRLEPAITAEGREAVRDIVAAGAGVGVISEAEFGADARLVAIPLEGGALAMPETLVCLSRRRDVRVVRAFMELAV